MTQPEAGRSGTSALIVVDLQQGFITPDSAHVIPVIAATARRWLDDGGMVVFTRFLNYPDSPYERLLGWREMQEPPATSLAGELAELAAHERAAVVDKRTYSALTPQSWALLGMQRVTDLYLCGLDTDGCVLATALAAFDSGLTPWVLEDAVATSAATHPADVHAAGLLIMSRLIGPGQLIMAAEARPRAGSPAEACEAAR